MSMLDKISNIKSFTRMAYGNDQENKPNDFCFWDDNFGYWFENDDHLRKRIEGYISQRKEMTYGQDSSTKKKR